MISYDDIKVVFTQTGGGWGTYHDLFMVAKNGDVYYSDDLNADILNLPYDFTIPEDKLDELDFEKIDDAFGCDYPVVTMYKVVDGELKELYREDSCRTPAVETLSELRFWAHEKGKS